MKRLLVISSAIIFTLSSCHGWFGHHIRGNGNVTTENRSVDGFDGIDVSGALDVYVTQDSSEAIKIETDANLHEYIITRVENGVLEIYPADHANLDPSRNIKIYVSGRNFKSFQVSGASDIYSNSKIQSNEEITVDASGASKIEMDLKAPKISGQLSGASNLKLSGATKDLTISASGASHAKCFELMSENADVDLSGASSADVFASVSVKGEASGASNVKYKGNATSVAVNTSGAGSVSKEN